MAALVADQLQFNHNPAVSVGLPLWEMRQSLHLHHTIADGAFAHIISSQQSPALSSGISTVLMEKLSPQNTVDFLVNVCLEMFELSGSTTQMEMTFSLDLKLTSVGVIGGNPRLSVDYVCNAKLSFILNTSS